MQIGERLARGRPWPKRIFALDVSRGIAALSVVFWHWYHFAFRGITEPVVLDRSLQPLYGLFRIFYEEGSRGVYYFFLLSGFIFYWLYKDPIQNRLMTFRNFWVLRISRLYPLHLITLLAVALLQFLFYSKTSSFFVYPFNDPYHFILNLGFASDWGLQSGWSFNGPAWSISIEVLLYMLFFIVAILKKGNAVTCLLLSLVSATIVFFLPNPILYGSSMFFLGGFTFYATSLLSAHSGRYRWPVYAIALVSWMGVIINYYLVDFGSSLTAAGGIAGIFIRGFPYYILFPSTLCSIALIEIDKGPLLKPISWIGDISYSSYLLHFPLQLGFALAVSYGIINPSFYLNPVSLWIFFSLLILLSYFSYIRFERPMQKWIRNKFTSA
jgi:peptidoglycan/LPS O-acetylase OafA/YrhL